MDFCATNRAHFGTHPGYKVPQKLWKDGLHSVGQTPVPL